jgi:hypothetical protein
MQEVKSTHSKKTAHIHLLVLLSLNWQKTYETALVCRGGVKGTQTFAQMLPGQASA